MRSAAQGSAPNSAASETKFDESAATDGREIELARAGEYLLLANLLARAPGAALLRDLSGIRGDASPLGMAHIALAQAARSATPETAAAEYQALFIGIGRGDVVPYASFYLTGFLHERPLARIREDMDRLGIERRAGVFEPEDHIASLFETMALLVTGGIERPSATSDRFFDRHVAPWAIRLMDDIAQAPSARFYKCVAELGRTWLEVETEAMRLPP